MTPTELRRHVATIARVLSGINLTQADNATALGRTAANQPKAVA